MAGGRPGFGMTGVRAGGPAFGFNGTRAGMISPGARVAFAQTGWRGGSWQAGNWQGRNWQGGTWRGANWRGASWRFNGHRRFVRNAFFFGTGLGFASDYYPYYYSGYYPSCWWQRVAINGGWTVQQFCSPDYSYY
jgi:hypothetical protein